MFPLYSFSDCLFCSIKCNSPFYFVCLFLQTVCYFLMHFVLFYLCSSRNCVYVSEKLLWHGFWGPLSVSYLCFCQGFHGYHQPRTRFLHSFLDVGFSTTWVTLIPSYMQDIGLEFLFFREFFIFPTKSSQKQKNFLIISWCWWVEFS